jgi:hypothetical protein
MGALAQIRDAIVRRIAVFVINLCDRVLPIDIKPRQSMGIMLSPVDPDDDISIPAASPGLHSRGHAPLGYPPIKKPRFRGIAEHFAQPIRAQG